MPLHQKKIVDLLHTARNATVAPRDGFMAAFNAVPAYQEYRRNELLAENFYAFDHITNFIHNRLRDLRSITILSGNGITLMFGYARSTGKLLVRLCAKAFDSVDMENKK